MKFSEAMIQEIVEKYSAKKIARLISVGGNTNIYEINFNDVKIAICQVMVGAPACVSNLEELIALGAQKSFSLW